MPSDSTFRYGNNPHQQRAQFTGPPGAVEVVNGFPSYTNLLDIITGWQIARDANTLTGKPAAVSMKHCIPIGLATPGQLDAFSYALLRRGEVEPTTSAYLRARSSDWGAAYGDMAVVFGTVTEDLAGIMARLVSDGIAATGYTDDAVSILSRKRKGKYLVVKLARDYVPPAMEARKIFGFCLTQQRNDYLPSANDFEVVVGSEVGARRCLADLMLSAAAMKYTVSNNIVIAGGGRTLAISAGQQSRILSTSLACSKLKLFMQLQHPEVVDYVASDRGSLTERISRAVQCASRFDDLNLEVNSPLLMASDGFIPFKDNIEEAHRHKIDVIWCPEGGVRGDEVARAATQYGMTLVQTRNRFFYH